MTTENETPNKPAAGDLGSMLFDDDPAGAPEAAPAAEVAPAPTAFAAPSSGKWPGTIPPLDMARSVMMGKMGVPPAFQALTESLKARMTPVENAVLSGQPITFDAKGLLNAIGMRWRIKVAIATRPAKDDQIDQQLVDVFLGEIDVAMKGIAQIPEGLDPPSKAAFDANKDALARAAMEVLSATPSSPNLPVVAVPPGEPVAPRKAVTAGKIRITEEVPAAQASDAEKKERRLRVWFAVVLVAGVLFHGGRILLELTAEHAEVVTIPGVAGVTVDPTTHDESMVFSPATPPTEDTVKLLLARSQEQGKHLYKSEARGGSVTLLISQSQPTKTEVKDASEFKAK